MGIKLLTAIRQSLHLAKESSVVTADVPKGHFAVYVGEEHKKRLVIPVSYLNQKWFKDLLSLSEEKFGFFHPMGCITIPCSQEAFISFSSCSHSCNDELIGSKCR